MSKRRNRDPGALRQVHPTRSFEQLVGDATTAKMSGYIDGEIQQLGQALLQRQTKGLQGVMQRIIAIEEILLETVAGLTKESLANRVADIQDRSEGFEAVTDGVAAEGDRVRLEIKTKTADQPDYQGQSRLQVDNVGSGNTLGKELEAAIVGMKAGDTKEIKFGKDESLTAQIALHKVSRQPVEAAEPTETKEEYDATEAAIGDGSEGAVPTAVAATEEAPSASPNAG